MAESVARAMARVRAMLLDDRELVRGVAAGRRRGRRPECRRVELRYVDLKSGRHLQVTRYDDLSAHTTNHPADAAPQVVDELLGQPFGNWHVDTTAQTVQLRITKKGEALVHGTARASGECAALSREHDRAKQRLLPEDHPMLVALGIADNRGKIKPTRQAKYRQVDEFIRALAAGLDDGFACGALRMPTQTEPLLVVDLGCGNAYLTFAARAYLADVRGLPARIVGVDARAASREHNRAVAGRLAVEHSMSFVHGQIASVELPRPDVVLALHACDTATDDALARAVEWQAPLVLAAPCCHHDIAAQLRRGRAPAPYASLTKDGILRERFADTLTDALRASLLRMAGYRVDVFAFVESKHTPRNTMLRAVRTGHTASADDRRQYDELIAGWQVRPKLHELLSGIASGGTSSRSITGAPLRSRRRR